jgi:hypothetical protein
MDEERTEIKKTIAVKIIKVGEKQTLVEFVKGGNPIRVTVANAKVKDGAILESDLDKAIPYGLDFKDIVASVPGAQDVENAFHNHGIWTAEDVKLHPDWVLAALSSTYSPILRALMQYIKAKKI